MKFEDTISDVYKSEFLSCCKNELDQVMQHFNPGESPYVLKNPLKTYINLLDKYGLLTPEKKRSFEEKFQDDLERSKFNHLKLRKICSDHDAYDIEDCILIILIWGQIRPSPTTLNLAWKSLNSLSIKKFLEDIRSGKENERKKIYSRFAAYRKSGKLKGIDTAYFTKIIYFLMNKDQGRGYILDQFTARSTNILLKQNIININKNGTVESRKNDAEVYEKYCTFIEDLAKYLDNYFRKELGRVDVEIKPQHSEIFIFYDNKDPSGWRKKSDKIFKENACSLVEVE